MDRVYKCISIHGGILYFSETENGLRTCNDFNHPHAIALTLIGGNAYFSYENRNGERRHVMPSNFGTATYTAREDIGDPIKYHRLFDNYIYFEKNRQFLSCDPDGNVDFKIYMEVYEKFYIVADDTLPAQILNDRWFSMDRRKVIDRQDVHILGNFTLDIGGVTATFDELNKYAHKISENEWTIIYREFRADRLLRYKPLIYLSAFGREQSFELLRMSIESIERHGNYKGDYMVLTNKPKNYIQDILNFVDSSRVIVIGMPVIDEMDMVCARFKVVNNPAIEPYQPILYMDTDIICNGDITRMFDNILCGQKNVCAKQEGDLSIDSYGNYLTSRDENAHVLENDTGFSTGVLGFKNANLVRADFATIINCIYSQIETGTSRQSHQVYDQPVANYYYNKLSCYDLVALDEHVHGWPALEDENVAGKGLIHFCGGVGPMHKIDRIRSYFSYVMTARAEQ